MNSEILAPPEVELLPVRFRDWFAARGWSPRPHQIALLEHAASGRSTLLIAPTGAGKTLAGFLPSLVALSRRDPHRKPRGGHGLHTLYVSPLKALAVDIRRNLTQPVEEMGLAVRLETRTGDTPAHRRQRQQYDPPDILLTTPEQVALLIAARGADRFFTNLDTVIFDELHAIVTHKRGDLLSLGLARLRALAPNLRTVGLSATVAEPDDLRAWLVAQRDPPPLAGEGDRAERGGGGGHYPKSEHESTLISPLEGEKAEPDIARRSSRKSMAKQEGGEGKAPLPPNAPK